MLTTDSKERKDVPVYSGCMAYFPDALAEVARLSKAGNDKHNPGEPLHWSRDKSNDHKDCAARHMLECGNIDEDGFYHDVKLAWRALANLQILLERIQREPKRDDEMYMPHSPEYYEYQPDTIIYVDEIVGCTPYVNGKAIPKLEGRTYVERYPQCQQSS